MKDFDTEFVFEDEKNKERKSLDSPSKILPHAIVNDRIEFVDDVNDKYLSVEKKKIIQKNYIGQNLRNIYGLKTNANLISFRKPS